MAKSDTYGAASMVTTPGKHYWEIIADQLSADGWSIGWIAFENRDFEGWKVDARQGDIVHLVTAEDINTAFIELQASVRRCPRKMADYSAGGG